MPDKPIGIWTLARLGDDVVLTARCEAREHSRKLNVPALLDRYRSITLDALRSQLRCSKCGKRGARLELYRPHQTSSNR
jgi:hypothetical protein